VCKYLFTIFISISFLWGHGSVHHRIDNISQQIENSKQNTELYITRAALYIESKHYSDAKKDLEIASKDKKNYLITQYYFAKINFLKQNYNKAEKDVQSLIENYPKTLLSRSLYQLSIAIYLASHQANKAIKTYKDFISKMPKLVMAKDYFLLTNLLIKHKKYNEALNFITKAIHRFGELTLFIEKRIEIHTQKKEYKEALEDIELLIQKKKRLPYLYRQKGKLYQMIQDDYSALQCYMKSLKIIQNMSTRQQKIPIIRKLKRELVKDINILNKK